jgi:hypothetical protein
LHTLLTKYRQPAVLVHMIKLEHVIAILLAVASFGAYGFGQLATATTTVEARITHWTEDPCDFPEHQDKCEVRQELNIPVITVRMPASTTQNSITNYE